MRRLCALPVLLMLGGCPPSQWGPAVETAIREKEAASDAEGQVFKHAPCAMTVGALYRLPAASDRQAIALLCGGGSVVLPP